MITPPSLFFPQPSNYLLQRPSVPNRPAAPLPVDDIGVLVAEPTQSNKDKVELRLRSDGKLVENSIAGPREVGRIDPTGNYQLFNGMRGNAFEGKQVSMGTNLSEVNHPFLKALQQSQRQRAWQASEIPLLRNRLHRFGITGQGITVANLDDSATEPPHLKAAEEAHDRVVAQVINDPIWGVAPGSIVQQLGKPKTNPPKDLAQDSRQACDQHLIEGITQEYNDMNDKLQGLLINQPQNPSLRVLNNTQGIDRVVLYHTVFDMLTKSNHQGYYKYPNARREIIGNAELAGNAARFKAIVNYTDWVLDNDPNIQAAKQRYIETTRQAAQRGLIMVCAAGNEQNAMPYPNMMRPGAAVNLFAESPYVIVSAAANTRLQPGNRSQYEIAEFSSRGDGLRVNPTVAAPGAEVAVSLPAGPLAHNNVVDGTSFSTPFTCGVIAMMLQRNPNLTFTQIKQKLQSTAVKSPHYGVADYGAGFLNAEAAVLS